MKTEFKLKRQIAFFNIFKWFLASVFIGGVVGVCNGLFLKLLAATVNFTTSFHYYFLALPLGLWAVNVLARKVAPKDTAFSTNEAIAAINDRRPISLASTAKAFLLPILTIGVGGSAGKEAPCADVGAGMASLFSKVFSFNRNERRKLMICGVSAGFAGVFGVPISGALFGLEVLSVGTVFYEVMFPAFIAGITSYQVTQMMGVEYIYHPMSLGALHIDSSLLHTVAAGLFFGLMSLLFIEILKLTRIVLRFIGRKYSFFWKIFIASAALIAIALVFSPVYLGLTIVRVDAILAGDKAATFGFLIKMFATGITFGAGGVGGLITPVMFIGANAGYFFADMLGLNTATFAALGIVSILAGVCNTPLAASVMAIELFGATIAPYAAVSCIVSFLVTGRRSVYSKQHFAFDKSMGDDRDEDACPRPQKRQSERELKRILQQKNFLLTMVRHLIPDAKPARESAKTQPLPDEKKENKKSFFSHLMPDIEQKDDKNSK